jgi:hypothetical protein
MYRPLVPEDDLILVQQDRESIRARQAWMAARAHDGWVDQSLASAENVLLEGQALVGGAAFSLINERARQLTFAQVTDRLMCIRKIRPSGLSMSGAKAAIVPGYFSTAGAAAAPKRIFLPGAGEVQPIRLQSGQGIWQLASTGVSEITGGSIQSPSLTLEQSDSHEAIEQASGFPGQIIVLGHWPVIPASIVVSDPNGPFDRVRPDTGLPWISPLEMGNSDRGYIILIDNYGKAYLQFGDGIHGVMGEGDIEILYKTGGGKDNAVVAGARWTILDAVYNEDGDKVTVQFTNSAPSSGGLDQMSVEEARVRMPAQIRAWERTVNEVDAEAMAETVGGVGQSALITSNHVAGVPEDVGRLYIVALGSQYSDSLYYPPAAPTDSQRDAIGAIFAPGGAAPGLMGTRIDVFDAVFKTVNIVVQVYKAAGVSQTAARSAIVRALQMHFAIADSERAPLYTVDFGFRLTDSGGTITSQMAWSGIFEVIAGTSAVASIPPDDENLVLNGTRGSVVLGYEEFPVLGTVTIWDMDEGVEI